MSKETGRIGKGNYVRLKNYGVEDYLGIVVASHGSRVDVKWQRDGETRPRSHNKRFLRRVYKRELKPLKEETND